MKKKVILMGFLLCILGTMNSKSYAAICDTMGHNYVWAAGSSATCTASGYNSYNCTRCGSSRTSTIAPLGHNWGRTTTTVVPTCTSTGTEVTYCTRCSASKSSTLSAMGHAWDAFIVESYPTCTRAGSKIRTCQRCFSNDRQYISAYGHSFGSYSSNDTSHWQDCGRNCGATQNSGSHVDTDDDGYCNTCGHVMFLPPTKPTIKVTDTAGNVLTSTWTNKDMYVYVDGSSLTAGKGGVAYQYQMNNASYQEYTNAVSYTSLKTDTTFYARAYNTGMTNKISEVASRVLPKIERDNPTFSISVDSNEYEKSHTATLRFADTGGSNLLATDYVVSYTWTNSSSTPASYDKTMTVSVAESAETTATITKEDGTGIYYLHVKLNKKIKDNATNECATTILSIPFYMDNTAPTVSLKTIDSNPTGLNKNATYSMDLIVFEEHSGLVTSEFTADDIVVKVNGVESTATKTLTYTSVEGNKYEYNLKIKNVTETGLITLEIKNESITDYATNKCASSSYELTKKNGDNFIGPFADNVIPVVSMMGEATLVDVEEDKNLSGVLDKKYVNKHYTIEIPIRIIDIGGQDFVNMLDASDFVIKAGETQISPTTQTVTLKSSTITSDSQTNLSIYQKDYILTLKGLLTDGYSEITSIAGGVEDFAKNTNVEAKFAPYVTESGNVVRIFVDNTPPQPTIKSATVPEYVDGTATIKVQMYIKEFGAGIREDQFDVSDLIFQINGKVVENVTRTLTPNAGNNHGTALGKDNSINYTYELTISGIKESGSLRIQVLSNKIIDKANNGNEAVTLEVNTQIDNKGPNLGPITTNADKNGEVFEEMIEVKITDCTDPSGIGKYEWQRSEDGTNFETIYVENSALSDSSIEEVVDTEKKYYYRVIVSDTLGNSTISDVVEVVFRNTLNGKPTLSLSKEQISSTVINIKGIIKSKSSIVEISIDGNKLPKSAYENNEKINNYEITTTFEWPVTQNGVYEVEVKDEKGNIVKGTINVNEFDFTSAIITPTKKDATLLTPAQIIFTSNEPVRIVDDDAYPGITFDTDDFGTKIIATVSPDVDFTEAKTFDFENKGLTKVEVKVDPPLITKFAYLRFAKVSPENLNMTVLEMNALTQNMRSAKMITTTGQVKSYYGFKNENVETKIATGTDIATAENLGNATETYIITETGELKKLEKDENINTSGNTNYTTGNISGMYKRTTGLLTDYSETLLNDTTIKHSKFRLTIVP